MTKKTKVLLSLSAVLAISLGALTMADKNAKQKEAGLAGEKYGQIQADKQMSKAEAEKAAEAATGGSLSPLPTVNITGSVEEITSDIAADLSAENAISASSDSDIDYLNSEFSSINTNDIYNENQF